MEDYDLEVENIKQIVKEKKAKTVLLQFPDGLKPSATKIIDQMDKKVEFYIWAGTCFGACDIPNFKADLLIQFGHSKFKE